MSYDELIKYFSIALLLFLIIIINKVSKKIYNKIINFMSNIDWFYKSVDAENYDGSKELDWIMNFIVCPIAIIFLLLSIFSLLFHRDIFVISHATH